MPAHDSELHALREEAMMMAGILFDEKSLENMPYLLHALGRLAKRVDQAVRDKGLPGRYAGRPRPRLGAGTVGYARRRRC